MYQSQAVIGITNARKNPPLEQCVWPADAMNNIPDWVYTSDANYQRVLSLLGEQGVVDTVGIVGYYSMLAMVLNTARTPGELSSKWNSPL